MTQTEPDYAALTLEQLLDVERHIKRELVPERWERLQAELASRRTRERKRRSRKSAAPRSAPDSDSGRLRVARFTFLHMLVGPVVVGLLLTIIYGADLAFHVYLPLAFFLSAGSGLIHHHYRAARRHGLFLVLSVLVTPVLLFMLGVFFIVMIGSFVFFAFS